MGKLIMTLGAMAAEHVFYGENSHGVGGDVASATATAAAMVGMWAMGPEPVDLEGASRPARRREHVLKRFERIGSAIMNRAGGAGMHGRGPDRIDPPQPGQEARARRRSSARPT